MTDFLKQPILTALREAGRPLDARQLSRRLGIDRSEQRDFRRFLEELQRRGELYRVKPGRFAPPDRVNLTVGHLQVIRSGAAFLIPERGGDDVFVRAEDLESACHGDKVVVRLEQRRRGRLRGRVVRVLERAHTGFVGTLRRTRSHAAVSPDDPKFPRDIFVPLADVGEARDGEKVVVEVADWGSARSGPVGRVAEVLGMPGDPGLDVLMIVKHNGLLTEFPDGVRAAAEALPEEVPRSEVRQRVDLRETQVVTIDPVDARDFDDALSLSERPDGSLELGVHIADVSHYVEPGSPLDEEARSRGTSVYLVDRVLPMLPEKLSNGLCSLNPRVDRLAMSVRMRLTPRGKLLEHRIEDSVIRSDRRLSYDEVQAFFDGDGKRRRELADVAGLLERLRALASALTARRMRRGALDFDFPETRVELDAEGYPLDIRRVVRLESHRLVEECMLLANETVARHLRSAKVPVLYRVHDAPNPARLDELRELLGRFGHTLRADRQGRVAPRELQRLLRDVDGRPEEAILSRLVLRSLARARYDVEPLGHYGLALHDYTHFTSPIRRYPDLVVHRTLRVLSGKQEPGERDARRRAEWLADTAALASDRERVAEGAERDSVELKKIHFMERHLGDEFPGVVAGVESFGVFVELDRYHVSGLVHVNHLGDDYYEHRESEFALVGSGTGRRFALGDRMTVKVAAVSRERRQIDFVPVETQEPAPRSAKPRPRRRARRRGA